MTEITKKERVRFVLVGITYLIGVLLASHILFGSITLVAITGYSNYAFWSTVVGGSGLIWCITMLYVHIKDWKKGRRQ